jgi:N-methylhydantoinase A
VAEETASLVTSTENFDLPGVARVLDSLTAKLHRFTHGLAQDSPHHAIEYIAEARYAGQVWELDTPIPSGHLKDLASVAELQEEFHRTHERVFAVRDEGSAVEFINWKARLSIPLADPPSPIADVDIVDAASASKEPVPRRDCYFGDAAAVATPIYKARSIMPGMRIAGPAIVEEPTTTLVVYPGMSVTLSAAGNYLLEI